MLGSYGPASAHKGTTVYVQAKKGCVSPGPDLSHCGCTHGSRANSFGRKKILSAIRWFRSTFFNTTIVAQPEWNHSRLSRDCSLLEELRNSTIGVRHARRSVAGYYFFPQGHSACVRTLSSSKHAGHYSHTSKAGACNVATAR